MKILIVLTSHDTLGNTGQKTGFWLEEFAAPYFVFRDAGVQLTLGSPKGGQPPLDPKSDSPENQTPAMSRFSKTRRHRRRFPRRSSSPTLNRKITIRSSMSAATAPCGISQKAPFPCGWGPRSRNAPTGSHYPSLMAVSLPDRIPRLRSSQPKTL